MKKILCALMVIIFPAVSFGGSLWDDRANWFGDARPGRVGDIITVLVDEQTDASDESDMSLTKNANLSVSNNDTGVLKEIYSRRKQHLFRERKHRAHSQRNGDSCMSRN